MVLAKPKRAACLHRWARSSDRWHRRAAAVGFVRGARQRMFFDHITRVSKQLLADQDDMVQKGLGWLLRETAKADPRRTVPLLMRIRDRAPRQVLRTACEKLPASSRELVLSHS